MSYTNKTTHYELPQYVATDKPKYLTDFNETMAAIDTQMYTNAQAAATADGKAVSAQSTADGAVSSIGTLNTQINGDPTDPSDTGLAGQVSGIDTDLDTVQSLIGSGQPTTSNQTIIGAINGLEGAVAPREDGDDLANSYSTGDQFARGGSVYEALVSLSAGTAFASLTLNTDYKVSDTLVEQIADVTGDVNTINSKLTGVYAIKGRNSVTVTADGVKTYGALIKELGEALLAAAQALSDNQKFAVIGLNVTGDNYAVGYSNLRDSGSTIITLNATCNHDTGTQFNCLSISMNSNDLAFNTLNIIAIQHADSSVAYSNGTALVPNDGATLTAYYETYQVL